MSEDQDPRLSSSSPVGSAPAEAASKIGSIAYLKQILDTQNQDHELLDVVAAELLTVKDGMREILEVASRQRLDGDERFETFRELNDTVTDVIRAVDDLHRRFNSEETNAERLAEGIAKEFSSMQEATAQREQVILEKLERAAAFETHLVSLRNALREALTGLGEAFRSRDEQLFKRFETVLTEVDKGRPSREEFRTVVEQLSADLRAIGPVIKETTSKVAADFARAIPSPEDFQFLFDKVASDLAALQMQSKSQAGEVATLATEVMDSVTERIASTVQLELQSRIDTLSFTSLENRIEQISISRSDSAEAEFRSLREKFDEHHAALATFRESVGETLGGQSSSLSEFSAQIKKIASNEERQADALDQVSKCFLALDQGLGTVATELALMRSAVAQVDEFSHEMEKDLRSLLVSSQDTLDAMAATRFEFEAKLAEFSREGEYRNRRGRVAENVFFGLTILFVLFNSCLTLYLIAAK